MFLSTRHLILAAVALDILVIALGAYALITIQEPVVYSKVVERVAQTYSDNRLSVSPDDLRRHYDRLYAAFNATEVSRQKAVALSTAAFRGVVILFSVNLFLLTLALKNKKT